MFKHQRLSCCYSLCFIILRKRNLAAHILLFYKNKNDISKVLIKNMEFQMLKIPDMGMHFDKSFQFIIIFQDISIASMYFFDTILTHMIQKFQIIQIEIIS